MAIIKMEHGTAESKTQKFFLLVSVINVYFFIYISLPYVNIDIAIP